MQNRGIVTYYPYFIAEKSGTLEISNTRIVIEAVEGDLWRLVTEGERDVTIMIAESNLHSRKVITRMSRSPGK